MRCQRLLLFLSVVVSVTLGTYACGDGTTEPAPYSPEPTTVTVSPATAELAALGATVQMSAQVQDQNGWVMAGATVTWASSATAVATVDASGLVTAVANGTATITATAGQASGSATVTVAQAVSSVTAVPAEANFAALGDTLQLTAEAFDANGHAVASAEFSWETSDDAVATVDATGLVTAAANGTATITATAGQASGSATVTVAQVVSSVTVAPAEASLAALGDTLRLTAEAFDANGHAVAGAELSWETSDDAVAMVDASGLVTATANGTAMIAATAGEASGSAAVTVAQVVSSVTVAPMEANFAALSDTLRLTAEAFDANGHAVAGAELSWETSDDAVATVDATGLVQTVANGAATITATAGESSGSAAVTVAQVVSSVTVAPAETNFGALGDTLRLTAQAFDANGHAVAGAEFSWESSDSTVATVDASGLVTTMARGSVTITATSGSVSGSAIVSVAQVVRTVAVTPDTATVVEGDTLRIAATATDANGQALAEVQFAWASGDTAVAVVDASGLVTAVGTGQAEVTATAAGVTGRTQLTVLAPVPTTIAVTPDTVVLTALGHSTQLTAEVRDQAGRAMEGVPVTWSSADTTIAVVDPAGLVRAVRGGAVTVTATAGEASGSAHVAVRQSAGSVTVSPSVDTVSPGDTLRLVAEAYDENGHVVEGAVFMWSSSDAPVATVDPSGLVRGAGEGTATITATAGDVSGTSEITVVNPDRAALVALYNATDGPNWVDNTNWLTDAPLGEWYGVSTDGAGRVVRLRLRGRHDPERGVFVSHGLEGLLPSELGDLSALRELDLSWNKVLSGPIPSEIGRLVELRSLNLDLNALSGPIPPGLGRLAELRSLILDRNLLRGSIPPELGRLDELGSLGLSSNLLTGSIPPELGNLANLSFLGFQANQISGPIPPELGNLVNLTDLSAGGNQLTGAVPPELGNLTNLRLLNLQDNQLEGPIPQSFIDLPLYDFFSWECLTGLCAPGNADFVAWVDEIGATGPFCNESDQAVLADLYDAMGGNHWSESLGWLGGPSLNEWAGVSTDSLGLVTALVLSDNGLSGRLPANVANLGQLTQLRIDGNALDGRLPLSLSALDLLDTLHYDGTNLCEPSDEGFQAWLDGIGSHSGTGTECGPPADRDALLALYEATGGAGWSEDRNWLSDKPLRLWHGVEVNGEGRVVALDLSWNALTGRVPPELAGLARLESLELGGNELGRRIPPELGALENLEYLSLYWNELSGAIPPELGDLSNLRSLALGWNALSGAIPPELGDLPNLWQLDLGGNDLAGAIPPELGNLSNLRSLHLGENDLAGPIPPELGDLPNLLSLYLQGNELSGVIPPALGGLSNLEFLSFGGNDLAGPIPPELGGLSNLTRLNLSVNDLSGPIPPTFGGLASLIELELSHNSGLAGAMPAGLRNLALESLIASGTELCVPREPAFEEWLLTITRRRIAVCGPPAAYLVQAVQSRAHPVPLVAGEEALLRVFVTAAMETTEGIPEVRARFYLNGSERHVVDVPGGLTPIPAEIDEGDLSKSANAEIPGRIVRPGLEMVVEIDPDGELDASLGVARRIPQEGSLAIEVREMPVLDLTVIPFLWSPSPDSLVLEAVDGMAADPEGHHLLEATRVLLPVGDLDVTAHTPVASTSNNVFNLLAQTEAIRVLEGSGGHYMGMMSGENVTGGASGVAYLSGRSSFSHSQVPSGTVAHELGHNMGLRHAPCGSAPGPDPSFPYPDGTIGAWGYDFGRARLVPATRRDHMSYCDPAWTSDYHFTNALRHRLADEGASSGAHAAGPVRSLLLWGGVDTTGTPFLNPAFIADAPPALPDSAGDYTVTGRDASGRELFSLNFAMAVALSEEAETSSFVFALPTQPGWADALASVTLSGPAGTTTLDGDSDISMAILRDPVTGRVRGFLRDLGDPEAGALARAAGGLDVLFSRGIPGASAWRR